MQNVVVVNYRKVILIFFNNSDDVGVFFCFVVFQVTANAVNSSNLTVAHILFNGHSDIVLAEHAGLTDSTS